MTICGGFPSTRVADGPSQDDVERMIRSGLFKIVDTRSAFTRETVGYLPGSVQADSDSVDPGEDAIFLVDDGTDETLCRGNVICYNDSLARFSDIVVYPKSVSFKSLSTLLQDQDSGILLIDVRNASELIKPGKIPGSVHLPLFEIPQAFLLSEQDFGEKYGFEKPNTEAKNVVLTCRSGRRIQVADARLKPLGYNHLRMYYGSFKDWVKNGGEVV